MESQFVGAPVPENGYNNSEFADMVLPETPQLQLNQAVSSALKDLRFSNPFMQVVPFPRLGGIVALNNSAADLDIPDNAVFVQLVGSVDFYFSAFGGANGQTSAQAMGNAQDKNAVDMYQPAKILTDWFYCGNMRVISAFAAGNGIVSARYIMRDQF